MLCLREGSVKSVGKVHLEKTDPNNFYNLSDRKQKNNKKDI